MRANIEVVEAIIGAAVIVADSDGGRWVGTPYFIVRDDGPTTRATAEGVDQLVGFPERVPLERHLLNDKPVLLEATYGIVRVYVRPDGEHVYLNDRYCKAVEHLLYSGEDSEFGEPVPPPFFSWWQQAGPLSPVGVATALDPASTILAVIMPVRLA